MKTKTNKQNKQQTQSSELPSRSEQLSGKAPENTLNTQHSALNTEAMPRQPRKSFSEAMAEATRKEKPARTIPYVNYAEREANRALSVERILDLLKRWMPKQYELAEVVGKWIWIAFPEQPSEQIRAELSQFGFHWNNARKCWQHPCGQTLPRGQQDPHEKYTSYFAADQVAA